MFGRRRPVHGGRRRSHCPALVMGKIFIVAALINNVETGFRFRLRVCRGVIAVATASKRFIPALSARRQATWDRHGHGFGFILTGSALREWKEGGTEAVTVLHHLRRSVSAQRPQSASSVRPSVRRTSFDWIVTYDADTTPRVCANIQTSDHHDSCNVCALARPTASKLNSRSFTSPGSTNLLVVSIPSLSRKAFFCGVGKQ